MRVIIAGAEKWSDEAAIRRTLQDLPADTTVIHGDCPGADRIGGQVAADLGYQVEMFEKNKADYEKYKRGAWRSLNERMVASGADLLLAFHADLHTPGMGKGTRHIIGLAEERGIAVKILPKP